MTRHAHDVRVGRNQSKMDRDARNVTFIVFQSRLD